MLGFHERVHSLPLWEKQTYAPRNEGRLDGCAIATAAMISGITYEETAARSRGTDPARARLPDELKALLEDLTQTSWRHYSVGPLPLTTFACWDWPIALFTEDSWWRASFGQWVVLKGNLVHDPSLGAAFALREYPRRDWLVTQVIEPADPDQLGKGKITKPSQFILERLGDDILSALGSQ